MTNIRRRPLPHPLTRRALQFFGDNSYNAANWIRAVRWLRKRGKWVADSGTPTPSWGIKSGEAQ